MIKVLASAAAVTAYFNPQMLPQKWVLPALIVLGVVSASKDFLITVGDYLDDGKRNNSFDVSKIMLLGLLLGVTMLLASCGTAADGQKTFIGATGGQWMVIGQGVLLREAPVVYGQVQEARAVTSAKQPVSVVP